MAQVPNDIYGHFLSIFMVKVLFMVKIGSVTLDLQTRIIKFGQKKKSFWPSKEKLFT